MDAKRMKKFEDGVRPLVWSQWSTINVQWYPGKKRFRKKSGHNIESFAYSICLSNSLNTTNASPTDSLYSATLACDNDSAPGTAHNQARSGRYSKHGGAKNKLEESSKAMFPENCFL